MVKGTFQIRNPFLTAKKIFPEKINSTTFTQPCPLSFCQKSEKNIMKRFCKKSKNPYFQAVFDPKNFYFRNRAPSHFGYWVLKKLIRQSREKLGTERTNGRTTVNLQDLQKSFRKQMVNIIVAKIVVIENPGCCHAAGEFALIFPANLWLFSK